MKQLYEKNSPMLLACIETIINSEKAPKIQEHYHTLQTYYESSADGLLSDYDRDIKIPDTGESGVIHHVRLGSMESDFITLVNNRMEGRRACWCILGATNLANFLCLHHTTGFACMFTSIVMRTVEIPAVDWKPLSASKAYLTLIVHKETVLF